MTKNSFDADFWRAPYRSFPNTQHFPSIPPQQSCVGFVSLHSSLNLRYPIASRIGALKLLGYTGKSSGFPLVSMPEVPIYKNGKLVTPKHDVRATRE
jgi:hypothetical protein